MRAKKFFSCLLVAVMCIQMLSMTSLATEIIDPEVPVYPPQESTLSDTESTLETVPDSTIQTVIVDDRDSSLVYTGTWHDDSGAAFHAGTARYTNDENASVELTFSGRTIQWYGQKDTNFGIAHVYIDGVLTDEVNANGPMETGVLLFERTDLDNGVHTIRIVRSSNTIDVDYFVYTVEAVPPTPLNSATISGNGVKVNFDADNQTLTLYRTTANEDIQMSKPATLGYPIINGSPLADFTVISCDTQNNIQTILGTGERMTIVSQSASTGLIRTYTLETSDTETGAIYTATTYQAGTNAVTVDWFVENEFELYNVQDRIWSYNGGGEGPMHYYDTIQKIDLTDSETFTRENRQDYTAASIPVADIYTEHGGISIGDASATRREVHTPVNETNNSAAVSIKWPGKTISQGNEVDAGQSFINVHQGDYYSGLRGYKNSMEHIGMIMPENVSNRSYELRWEGWGWGTNWTVDLIIGKLDELEAAGIKQITIDDGWYNSAGDWELDSGKFPNGISDMLRLTDAIHSHGMTAILWWRPNDGGRDDSTLYQTHPEYYVKNADGSTAKLQSPGVTSSTSWNTTLGYALCPTSAGAIASQEAFIDRAMNDWGFDGFKADYVWSMPRCYDASHNHPYPEESTEKQAEFYRTAYETMVGNDPDVFNLLCNCGTPQDYYSLQYMTQIATADPTSVDQTRRRAKAYKALVGDYFPVTTDHNDIWYPSAVGTGSVLIEKRALTGAAQADYERWLSIADSVQLHKGRFIGDLYCYGFDPYETYVVEKDGVLHYAFYRDGNKYRPTGYPTIELKGLNPDRLYRVVDYVNNRVIATNLPGDNAVFDYRFSNYLLVKAVELDTPDEQPADPNEGFVSVDAMDDALIYTGTWYDDQNDTFHNGTARYSTAAESSVELTFIGTTIRWYGQNDLNFGIAQVYLDDLLVATVDLYGGAEAGKLLFEAYDLAASSHTIRVVCDTPVIDVDRFTYEPCTPEAVYEIVDDTSDQIVYNGSWESVADDSFHGGSAHRVNDPDAYAEFAFTGTAVRWVGKKGFDYGRADVYIDEEWMGAVTIYGQEAYDVVLYAVTGLEEGDHTIRVAYNAGAFNVDYFSYSSDE